MTQSSRQIQKQESWIKKKEREREGEKNIEKKQIGSKRDKGLKRVDECDCVVNKYQDWILKTRNYAAFITFDTQKHQKKGLSVWLLTKTA